MGADNLASFHRWQQWRDIASRVPIAVVDRPGWHLKALASPAAQWMRKSFVPEARASLLPGSRAPSWTFLTGPLSKSSSTEIRNAVRRIDIGAEQESQQSPKVLVAPQISRAAARR